LGGMVQKNSQRGEKKELKRVQERGPVKAVEHISITK